MLDYIYKCAVCSAVNHPGAPADADVSCDSCGAKIGTFPLAVLPTRTPPAVSPVTVGTYQLWDLCDACTKLAPAALHATVEKRLAAAAPVAAPVA